MDLRKVIQAFLALAQAVLLIAIVRAAIPRLGPDPRPKSSGDVVDFVSPLVGLAFQGAMWIGAALLLVALLAAGLAIERKLGLGAQVVFALAAPGLLLGLVQSRPIAPHTLEMDAQTAIRGFLNGGPISLRDKLATDDQKTRFDDTVTSYQNLERLLVMPHPDLVPLLEEVQGRPTTQRKHRQQVTIALVYHDIGLHPESPIVRGEVLGPSLQRRVKTPEHREAVFRFLYGPAGHDTLRPDGLLFDADATEILEQEADRWVREEIPDAGGFLVFSYVTPGLDDPFARAWASLDSSTKGMARIVSSGLHWWSAFGGRSPWNEAWASDDDLRALGAALSVLRTHRRVGPRTLGDRQLELLLEAQSERPGAEALLDPKELRPAAPR